MPPNTGRRERDSGGEPRSDHLIDLVTNKRNREIGRYLFDRAPTTVHLSTLVRFVRRQEATSCTEDCNEQRNRIATDLHHCRLPQLSDAQVIEYNPDSQTVDCRPSRRVERTFLELVAVADRVQ